MAEETDSLKNTVDAISDQFKQMHRDLDKLTGATEEQTKETKKQTKETKKQNKDTKDQSKKRQNTLKAMQAELRRTQLEQGASMADVAAEHLAGGGGVGGAVKAAAGHKVSQLKHKFDPLNIVKKITGGSKLAVALAGKVMGRSEKSIRSFADLAPGMDLPTSMFGKGKGSPSLSSGEGRGPSRMGGDPENLDRISATLAGILERLTSIEGFEEESVKLAQLNEDRLKDKEAVDAVERKKPSAVPKSGSMIINGRMMVPAVAESGGWFGTISKMLMPILTTIGSVLMPIITAVGAAIAPLLIPLGLLGVAAYMLYQHFDEFKLSFSLLGDSVNDLYNTLVSVVQSIKEWFGNALTSASDAVTDTKDSVVNSVKGVFGMAPTEKEKTAKLKKDAAGGDAYSQRKLAKIEDSKVATPGDSSSVLKKIAPKFAEKLSSKNIPSEELTGATESLRKGELNDSAIKSIKGEAPPSGSPTKMAATGALTQMVSEAYGQLYKDKDGKPLRPSTDTSPEKDKRVANLTKEAATHLAGAITPSSSPTPATPTTTAAAPTTSTPAVVSPTAPAIPSTTNVVPTPSEIPATDPRTGLTLSQAADNQKNAQSTPASGGPGAAVINNVRNNQSSVTNVLQNMPPARSGESSYLRSLDRGYVPA